MIASFDVNNALPKIMQQIPRVESENLFFTGVTVYLEQVNLGSSYQVPLIVNNSYKQGDVAEIKDLNAFLVLMFPTFVVVVVLGLRYRLESV